MLTPMRKLFIIILISGAIVALPGVFKSFGDWIGGLSKTNQNKAAPTNAYEGMSEADQLKYALGQTPLTYTTYNQGSPTGTGYVSRDQAAAQGFSVPNPGSYTLTPLGDSSSFPGGSGTSGGSTYTTDITNKLSSLNALYEALYGDIEKTVQDRRSQYDTSYNKQLEDVTGAYTKSQEQLPNVYGARGLSNSSYFENALTDAAKTFNDTLGSIGQNRDQVYAQLGQYANQTKAGFQAGQNALKSINPANLDATTAQSLAAQLDQQIAALTQQRAGLGTNQEFISGLNRVAPSQQTGTNQLSKQLQTLVTSSAASFAKEQIAKGLIKAANLTDKNSQDYWFNYYQTLLGQQAQPRVA